MADDPNPTPPPAPAPAPAADPAASTRQREADLRAEAAAERVAKKQAQEQLTAAQAQIEALRGETEAKIRTEVEKVGAKLTKMQSRVIEAEVKAAAQAAGLVDLDLLPLLDRSGVKLDDEGNLSGVAEAIEGLKTKKPDWFKAAPAAGAGGGTPPATGAPAPKPAGTGTADGKVDARKLSPEEYRAFKAKQLASLRH